MSAMNESEWEARLQEYLDNQPPGYLQQNIGYQLIAVAAVFIVLEVAATTLRAFARHLNDIRFMWADVLMLLSLFFNVAVCISAIVSTRYGVGVHIWDMPKDTYRDFHITADYVVATTYVLAVTFPKLALLDLYLHIFVTKVTRYATYAIGVVLTFNAVANFIVIMAQCRPVSALWNGGGYCINDNYYFCMATLVNIATDLAMLILPIPMVVSLQTTKRIKASILVTFLVGGLGLVTSILRLVQFIQFGKTDNYFVFVDQTFYAVNVLIWTVVEPGVYHITACSVSLRPLFPWLKRQRPMSVLRNTQRTSQTSMPETMDIQRHHRLFGGQGSNSTEIRSTPSKIYAPKHKSAASFEEIDIDPAQQRRSERAIEVMNSFEVSKV